MSTTKKVKIIVPGSSNADLTGFAPHLPAAGETVMGSSLHIGIGGKGCNQMTAAGTRRRGRVVHHAGWAGRVRRDSAQAFCRRGLP